MHIATQMQLGAIKLLSLFTKQKPDQNEDFPYFDFNIQYDFLIYEHNKLVEVYHK